jgi:hypothetical protein
MATLAQVLEDVRQALHGLDTRPPDTPVSPLVESFLLSVYRLGLALELDPALRDPDALATLVRDLEPGLRRNLVFLESYPQDVIAQFQRVWEGGERAQVSRLRSALAFFEDLIHGAPIAAALPGLAGELEDLDAHIRRWGDREGGLEVTDPGVPRSHTWWRYPAP